MLLETQKQQLSVRLFTSQITVVNGQLEPEYLRQYLIVYLLLQLLHIFTEKVEKYGDELRLRVSEPYLSQLVKCMAD